MAISLPSRTAATMPHPHEQKLHDVVNSFTFARLRFLLAALTFCTSTRSLIASPAPPAAATLNHSLRLTGIGTLCFVWLLQGLSHAAYSLIAGFARQESALRITPNEP